MTEQAPETALSVLVIEDNPADARLVELFLREDPASPFRVTKAERLSQGLEVLKTQPVDVVLLDLSLPDSFGVETLSRLRAASPVPVVVLTGTSDEGLALEALRQGAQDYLVKGQGDGELVRRAIRYAMGRSHADAEIRASEERFRTLFDNAASGVILSAAGGKYLHCNPAFCEMVGYSDAELQEMDFSDLTHPDDVETHRVLRDRMLVGELDSYTITKRYLAKNGQEVWARLAVKAIKAEGETTPRHTVAVVEDISQRKRLEDHMRLATTVFENTGEGLFVTDARRRIIHVNPAFTELTGYQPEDVMGHTPRILSSGRHNAEFYEALDQALHETGKWQGEIWNRRKSGEMFAEWLNIGVVRNDNGSITNYVAVFSDITSRKQDEERLNYQANHDPLTRLPNRTLFQERLSRALTRANRAQSVVALLFIDLDFFKQVNDTLGHLAGDILLQQVAERLSACVRQGDTVARLAGDEFTVILEDIVEAHDAALVANKILAALASPFELQGHPANISSSIGVSLYPTDAGDPQTLVKLADAAMYRAKHEGRNGVRFNSDSINAIAFERLALENALRHALEQDQFMVYYQPIFDRRSGSVIAVEALLRWRHPELGVVLPRQFLPSAEETGQLAAIGQHALLDACRQAGRWHAEGFTNLRLNVNLSPRQLHVADLDEQVAAALEAGGLPASQLCLEVPESSITDKNFDTSALFARMAALGVNVVVDAFGSGYSSFSMLRRLPCAGLKMDQSFVRNAASSDEEGEIVAAIRAVATGLRIKVVAPGIETVEQLDAMAGLEIDQVQGFLLAHPMPADRLTEYLRAGTTPPALAARTSVSS